MYAFLTLFSPPLHHYDTLVAQGSVVEQIMHEDRIVNQGPPDFVLCLGDDSSDEPMFTALYQFMADTVKHHQALGHILTCTVGKKVSNAHYYLSDQKDVADLLEAFTNENAKEP